MRYLGGKSRLAKSIRDVILSRVENTDVTYWEPFVGGCGSFEVIAPEFKRAVGSDIHPDLILMWQSVMKGWVPPTDVSPEQYQELRDSEPSALRGFVGFGGSFGGSFGGKWFGGYAKGGYGADGRPRNHQAESSRNVRRTQRKLQNLSVQFLNKEYQELEPAPGDVVYCDPPYAGTTEYLHSGFDSNLFWGWCNRMTDRGVRVFVSEYEAPVGWVEVYRKEILSSVDKAENRRKAVDRLFTKL